MSRKAIEKFCVIVMQRSDRRKGEWFAHSPVTIFIEKLTK
jgi:hypothetical protein